MYKAADNVALTLDTNAGRPLQAQLFEQVRAMIIEGKLTSGAALPATRALSEQLGVSRNTVVLAYDRLLSEGYIESKRSIGTFVSDAIPSGVDADNAELPRNDNKQMMAEIVSLKTPEADVLPDACLPFSSDITTEQSASHSDVRENHALDADIDFRPDLPDGGAFPLRSWRRIVNRLLSLPEAIYGPAPDLQGMFELRRSIAEYLGPARGILTNPDEVIIVSNAQEGRSLLCQLLLAQKGTSALMELPGPAGLHDLYSHYDAEIFEIGVDDEGILTEQLPTDRQIGGMAYVTPSHHFPLGVGMSLARRVQLLEWALKAQTIVIEDESTSEFRYVGSPLTALKGLDTQGNVVYLGSFAKTLGVQIGYLVVPQGLVRPLMKLKILSNSGVSWLEQGAMAEFMDNGAYERHLRKLRKKCMAKRDLIVSLLKKHFGSIALDGLDGGLHLIWHLPPEYGTAKSVAKHMRVKHNIGFYTTSTGGAYSGQTDKPYEQALILGYSSLTLDEIEDGIEKLAAELKQLTGANA